MEASAIIGAVEGVTKKWAKHRKREERDTRAVANRSRAMTSVKTPIKYYAMKVTEEAYQEASDNGRLPAYVRQIMYAARRLIQNYTDDDLGDKYYIQTILQEYFQTKNPSWKNNVVTDARGHFAEPHTKVSIGVGTLEVRKYLKHGTSGDNFDFEASTLFPTHGVVNRMAAILFVEKEGFLPLFEAVNLADRYDLGILSTKGQTVVAARKLVDELCGRHGIPLLLLKDFDKAGFSMLGTFKRSSQRYRYRNTIKVIDLGIRLADVDEWNIDSESFHSAQDTWTMKRNLRKNGATEQEIAFIADDLQRVELNALPSQRLVEFIEAKLAKHRIKKVVPDTVILDEAYRRALRNEFIRHRFEELKDQADEFANDTKVPALKRKVATILKDDPTLLWDKAIAQLAAEVDYDND